MNNYPSWWNQTITVYNKYTDPQTRLISWYRTVVPGAFWKDVGDKIKLGETVLDTNKLVCRLRKDDTHFLERFAWEELARDEKTEFYTLGIGDIIIKGEVYDEINEYESGSRATDILAKYKRMQGCMVIDRLSINTDGGRGNEHYLVKGV